MDLNHLNNFKSGSYKDYSYQVWSKSSQYELSFEAIVDDGRQTADIQWSQ